MRSVAKLLWNADPSTSKDMRSMTVISFVPKWWKLCGTGRLLPSTLRLKNVETLNASPQEENNKEAAMIA